MRRQGIHWIAPRWPRPAQRAIQRAAYSNGPQDSGESVIAEKLKKALQPTRLQVQDISGGCGSMYAIEIASDAFKGMTMIKQHRWVNQILADEIAKMHGLQLKTTVSS